MRSVVGAFFVIATLAGSSAAEEIYRWSDSLGGLHFQNVPSAGRSIPREEADSSAASEGSGAHRGDVAVDENGQLVEGAAEKRKKLSPEEATTYSTDVSIRRSRLERELRGAEGRLREIDGRLTALERARLKNSRGSEATGGVAAFAHDVLSPEEETLVEERDELAQRTVDVRNDAAVLRQEVEARLGTVPAWWTDLR